MGLLYKQLNNYSKYFEHLTVNRKNQLLLVIFQLPQIIAKIVILNIIVNLFYFVKILTFKCL